MEIVKEKSVCFTGYRTSKLLRSDRNAHNLIQQIYNDLHTTIASLYERGYRTFYSGMAEGFDMMAAEVVMYLKESLPDIQLIAVIPFQGQELGYTERDKERYERIYHAANDRVFTSDTYHDKAYFMRNDYMLAHSSIVVCYYDGQRGGTMYTYNRAIKHNKEIVNLCSAF